MIFINRATKLHTVKLEQLYGTQTGEESSFEFFAIITGAPTTQLAIYMAHAALEGRAVPEALEPTNVRDKPSVFENLELLAAAETSMDFPPTVPDLGFLLFEYDSNAVSAWLSSRMQAFVPPESAPQAAAPPLDPPSPPSSPEYGDCAF